MSTSSSIAVAGKPGKRPGMPVHKPQAVSDWLNPHYLGGGGASQPLVSLQI